MKMERRAWIKGGRHASIRRRVRRSAGSPAALGLPIDE
jgi:hypothetical protein